MENELLKEGHGGKVEGSGHAYIHICVVIDVRHEVYVSHVTCHVVH